MDFTIQQILRVSTTAMLSWTALVIWLRAWEKSFSSMAMRSKDMNSYNKKSRNCTSLHLISSKSSWKIILDLTLRGISSQSLTFAWLQYIRTFWGIHRWSTHSIQSWSLTNGSMITLEECIRKSFKNLGLRSKLTKRTPTVTTNQFSTMRNMTRNYIKKTQLSEQQTKGYCRKSTNTKNNRQNEGEKLKSFKRKVLVCRQKLKLYEPLLKN